MAKNNSPIIEQINYAFSNLRKFVRKLQNLVWLIYSPQTRKIFNFGLVGHKIGE